MATTTPSTVLVPITPVFSPAERLALAGFLAAYSGLTRQAYELDLRQFASWCQQHQLRLSVPGVPILSSSPGTWRPAAGPGPLSPAACAPLPGSTATPSKKNSSTTHPPPTCAAHGLITSLMPSPWTATNLARCWSPPGSGRRRNMR